MGARGADGTDRVLSMHTRFGLGFGRLCKLFHVGSETAFGRYVAGGSAAFSDRLTGSPSPAPKVESQGWALTAPNAAVAFG